MLKRLFAVLMRKRAESRDADYYPIVGQSRRHKVRNVSDEWPVEETSEATMFVSASPAIGPVKFDPPSEPRWPAAGLTSDSRRGSAPGPSGDWSYEESSEKTVFAPAPSSPNAPTRSNPYRRAAQVAADGTSQPRARVQPDDPTVFFASRRKDDAGPSLVDNEVTQIPVQRGRDRNSSF